MKTNNNPRPATVFVDRDSIARLLNAAQQLGHDAACISNALESGYELTTYVNGYAHDGAALAPLLQAVELIAHAVDAFAWGDDLRHVARTAEQAAAALATFEGYVSEHYTE